MPEIPDQPKISYDEKIRPNLTHWHVDYLGRRKMLQQPPECCREIAEGVIKAAYRAGYEAAKEAWGYDPEVWELRRKDETAGW